MRVESKKSGIRVNIRFFTTLREIVGQKEEEVEFSRPVTLETLLKALSRKHGKEFAEYVYDELGSVRGHLHLLINGKSVTALNGLRTKLNEGDQIAILPPVGGGRDRIRRWKVKLYSQSSKT